jgi:arabinofuranosyltransferase
LEDPGAARRLDSRDALCALALLLFLGAYVHFQIDLTGRPEEDAAMLLRYSQHLAQGYGVVWNVGEKPVDGATDFLFMVAVAALHRAGLPLERAAQALGLTAHALTVIGVFLSIRSLFGGGRALALIPAVFLAVGPGLRHLAACYGTPLFALTALTAWYAAHRLLAAEPDELPGPSLLFALASLVMGLARPEGVFLAVFMLAAVLYGRRASGASTILTPFLAVFLTLGLAYFLWRWSYFGHPLPNPFYKKGAGLLHWYSLRQSFKNLAALGPPFLLVLGLGLFVKGLRRWALFALLPAVAFTALWILISDETNYVMRFRYPILPLLLVSWVPVGHGLLERVGGTRVVARHGALVWPTALAVAIGLALYQHEAYRYVAPRRMGLYDAALVLREYRRRNYALATTEAGLLPLYSTWRALDAWGLNDAIVARGGLSPEYLDRYRPEVILFHAYFSPAVPADGERVENRSLGPRWYQMVTTLKSYAEHNGYVLAACFGRNAYDTHYYYVRPGLPESAEIAARVRGLDYYWDGEPTVDFTDSQP